MRGMAKTSVATLLTVLLAIGGIAFMGASAQAASSATGASKQVHKVKKPKPKKAKKAKHAKKAKKAKKNKKGIASASPRYDDGFWQPHVSPRRDEVTPGSGSDNPGWVEQLTPEQMQCLVTEATEVLAGADLGQFNMFTLLNYLPQFETALTDCNIDLPSEGEMGQMQSNIFFWYLGLTTVQKTCLSNEWQAIVDAGVEPTDDLWAMATDSLNTCGVTAPFGLG